MPAAHSPSPVCQYCGTSKGVIRVMMIRWGKDTLEIMCPKTQRSGCRARIAARAEAMMDDWVKSLDGAMRREAMASIRRSRENGTKRNDAS